MQPAPFRQEDILLVEINNAKSTSPAMSSGEECGLLSRTAAGSRAYPLCELSVKRQTTNVYSSCIADNLQ